MSSHVVWLSRSDVSRRYILKESVHATYFIGIHWRSLQTFTGVTCKEATSITVDHGRQENIDEYTHTPVHDTSAVA